MSRIFADVKLFTRQYTSQSDEEVSFDWSLVVVAAAIVPGTPSVNSIAVNTKEIWKGVSQGWKRVMSTEIGR